MTRLWLLVLFSIARGQESCDFVCPYNYDPVCGSDGITYSNECVLGIADCLSDDSISVAYPGECKTKETCEGGCPFNFDPVCGSDGVTYPNLCTLQLADCLSEDDITLAYPGECHDVARDSCDFGCPDNIDPVCGTDGVTYPNLCELERADCLSDEDITLAYPGECQALAKENCDFSCPDHYVPVCGSDGVTYPNECSLELADCLSEDDISLVHTGTCDSCDFGCGGQWDPVCGSDGITYSNPCSLEHANCLSEEEITMAYPGECQALAKENCDFSCLDHYDPVCGSNCVTYPNECILELADCLSEDDISFVHTGACGSCDSGQWDPVCGSDGITYANPCSLEHANCLSEEEITMAHPGEC